MHTHREHRHRHTDTHTHTETHTHHTIHTHTHTHTLYKQATTTTEGSSEALKCLVFQSARTPQYACTIISLLRTTNGIMHTFTYADT